jgi:hypothetical protein
MSARLTASELAEKYGISRQLVSRKMNRHGYKKDSAGKYSEEDFLKAQAAGMQADKAAAAKQLANEELAGETLQAQLLRRKIKLLDVDIQTAEAKLAEMLGRVIEMEKHKDKCQAIAHLMITWWEQASENASIKVKDATVLDELRRAGERARIEILEFA